MEHCVARQVSTIPRLAGLPRLNTLKKPIEVDTTQTCTYLHSMPTSVQIWQGEFLGFLYSAVFSWRKARRHLLLGALPRHQETESQAKAQLTWHQSIRELDRVFFNLGICNS